MAVQLCTPQMLNFSFSQAGQSGSRPRYILLTADVDKLVNSRDVLEQLRNQFGSRELAAEEIWQSYQTFYTGPGRAVRYKMTAGTSMKCNLGHIPMTVIAWRETGTGASGIDVVGRVDTSPRRRAQTSSVECSYSNEHQHRQLLHANYRLHDLQIYP
ncbi:uncharacterized protein PAC_04910 [Phialocephala subalpina]|uniref:Uncharacterized protein n=1 Tax=Phialocephala subalpina TaxID=576137 RepID=A0A1L7WQG5_9HELO|nr:uncharacterized protein PAC_04910 [Phialocephala subalpina]